MTEILETQGARVLVTGSSGFIGRWLCDRLSSEGYSVLGIDKCMVTEKVAWAQERIDLLDRVCLNETISNFRPKAVVHLAARTDLQGTSLADYSVNIKGVKNLCDAIAASGGVQRVIYTSSQLVCRVGYLPQSFDDYAPSTVYGESKVLTEKAVREFNHDASWCLTRPTTVWGPGMSMHYQGLIKMINQGLYFHSGSGPLYKSYSYIENIVQQYLQLLLAPAASINGKTFYLADYHPLSLREYTNRIADHLGKRRPFTLPLPLSRALALIGDALNAAGLNAPYTTFRLNNIRTEYVFDLSATEEVCGPVPVSFEEGVRRTVRWFVTGQLR